MFACTRSKPLRGGVLRNCVRPLAGNGSIFFHLIISQHAPKFMLSVRADPDARSTSQVTTSGCETQMVVQTNSHYLSIRDQIRPTGADDWKINTRNSRLGGICKSDRVWCRNRSALCLRCPTQFCIDCPQSAQAVRSANVPAGQNARVVMFASVQQINLVHFGAHSWDECLCVYVWEYVWCAVGHVCHVEVPDDAVQRC